MALSFASLYSFPHKNTTHNFNSISQKHKFNHQFHRNTHHTFALNYASKTQNKRELPIEKKVQEPNKDIELEVLYDDGFGSLSVKDCFRAAKDLVRDDVGPPRWFSPIECGRPVKNAPLLLFLPGR